MSSFMLFSATPIRHLSSLTTSPTFARCAEFLKYQLRLMSPTTSREIIGRKQAYYRWCWAAPGWLLCRKHSAPSAHVADYYLGSCTHFFPIDYLFERQQGGYRRSNHQYRRVAVTYVQTKYVQSSVQDSGCRGPRMMMRGKQTLCRVRGTGRFCG